jgi:DUF1680 family protein
VPSELYRYAPPAAPSYAVLVNGEAVATDLARGYVVLRRTWRDGDVVALELPMLARRVLAHEGVAEDRGKVALERGPLVYCAEGIDNDGSALDLIVPDEARIEPELRRDLLGGVTVLGFSGVDRAGRPRRVTAIPYFAWSNRGAGEMAVWLHRREVGKP